MFFIVGVSPKIKKLDNNPRRCPICGLNRACLKRIDHYLSLFFIPILRVKKGEPFVVCDLCEAAAPKFGDDDSDSRRPEMRCKSCGSTVPADFRFCPYCGKRL